MIYTCPNCSAKFQYDRIGMVLCPSCNSKVRVETHFAQGSAWDRAKKGGWAGAFLDTVKLSLFEPVTFFSEASAGRGFLRPLAFAVIISVLVFVVAMAYQAGFQALSIGLDLVAETGRMAFPFALFAVPLSAGVIAILSIIMVPVATALVLFVQAAIYHLCLMLLGAARRDFEATFRVVCYATGPQLFQIVPLLGAAVGWVWQIVLNIIGLKVVHDTTYGRSALAVFLPTVVCCGSLFLLIVAIAGGVTAALMTHAH